VIPELIYCADGSPWSVEIARNENGTYGDHRFIYGARLPATIYAHPEFVDQDWSNPNLERYVEAVAEHRPRLATVLDWERWEQLPEVLAWAEAVAPYVKEAIIIIPKVAGGIARLPGEVGGRPVRLGFSVQTGYSGTPVHPVEFLGWPVHLLGGSPLEQMKKAGVIDNQERLLESPQLNVVSVDCNYHLGMANRGQFFIGDGSADYAKNRYWPTLRESAGRRWGDGSTSADANREAFRRSCRNIWAMWHGQPLDYFVVRQN
jgi:hypothetical protein